MTEYVRDLFARTVGSGWGSADTLGGVWTEALTTCTSSVQASGHGTIVVTGTSAGIAFEKLAAATAALDVTLASAFRVTTPLNSEHRFAWFVRVSGALGDPVAYGVIVYIGATGTIRYEIGRMAAGGVWTVLASSPIAAAGTYVVLAAWRVELGISGSPAAKLKARIYPVGSIPDVYTGWLYAGDASGPLTAGVYSARLSRVAPGVSGASWLQLDDLYVSAYAAPAFTWTPTGLSVAFSSAPSTGDFTAFSWAWGDGTAAGSGTSPTHVYAAAGGYQVTLTATTRWGTTYIDQRWVTVAAPPPAPPALMPVVRINGVDVCDDLYGITWNAGRDAWTGQFAGQTCSIRLRGQYPALQGQSVTVARPTGTDPGPLWAGTVDQVLEQLTLDPTSYDTLVTAMDTPSFLARWHIPKETLLVPARLPERLGDLAPKPGISYRAKWAGVPASRFPMLDQKVSSLGELRDRTYLDLIRDALLASIGFAYQARDGAIVYAPWDAPAGIGSTPDVDLDTGPDCASYVGLDRNSLAGIVNRWTVGSGEAIDIQRAWSIEAYGERAYSVPAETLLDELEWPTLTTGMIDAMATTVRAATVEVPVVDWDQDVIDLEPLDLALCRGTLMAVMGVRHEINVGDVWRVTVTLDRNPWAVRGAAPP